MDKQVRQFQRRAVIGERHFVLANPEQPDIWALAGTVVQSIDKQGVRSFGPARTISTGELIAWAAAHRLPFYIEENFPVIHHDIEESLAA
jgi:hypothetical protein